MDKTIFHPCQKCGSEDYDKFEQTPEDATCYKFGKSNEIHPVKCDKCDLQLMDSESGLIH